MPTASRIRNGSRAYRVVPLKGSGGWYGIEHGTLHDGEWSWYQVETAPSVAAAERILNEQFDARRAVDLDVDFPSLSFLELQELVNSVPWESGSDEELPLFCCEELDVCSPV